MALMRAGILTETGFEIQQRPVPPVGDHEVLLRTLACGICSGDVFVYKQRQSMAAGHSLLGHEGSGVVAALGRSVTGYTVGEVVTALGMPAYADYFVTIPEKLVRLPPEVHPALAVGEAVACSVHAAGRFGTRPGDRVAVAGCGFMGLMALQLARLQGAGFLAAVDPVDYRREMAGRLGADVTLNPEATSAADILEEYGEFDVVVEAVGSQAALDLCTPLARQHGRLILIGYHQSNGGRRTVDMQQWNFKGLEVVNAHVRLQDEKAEAMREGMELLREGKLITGPLVTTYSFDDIEKAFQELAKGKPGLFKGVLLMEEP
jgi:threonine dehydrogenase-like Zn-dependent dehydrogenase